jgi:Family of unknown function (DUF5681)
MKNGVGRGHPPVETRFKKGQSGNPGGRPKLPLASERSAFDIIDRTLTVRVNEASRELTVEAALEQKTFQLALQGNRRAQREMLKMILVHEHAKNNLSGKPSPMQIRWEEENPENAFEAMRVLDIAHLTQNEPALGHTNAPLLEPWAVQAALGRRGRGPLSRDDIAAIEKATREPQMLRWPKNIRRD